MHHLVYTSSATLPFPEQELRRLLVQWRANNARLGVTGVLMYSDGDIMQVLEGESDRVHDLFDVIAADVRHQGVTKIADGPVRERAFADWSMRFRAVDIADFQRHVEQLRDAPNHASDLAPLLEAFMAPEAW
ncbi:BLUF domain-containing protein [Hymenobacter sp. BT683]|uniref:BLUF domain-containing protein n=1 Tax=Hymenobacter jeongseonensis TaxID=2791027 RepID=A0ABS0IEA2_9BACT|nr:BLUF domain-containing protein [Hymenobacter jeongseonensis]MBF9236635.1 BLUF domain-containing protein [Hymenobacter jeongseonensis]